MLLKAATSSFKWNLAGSVAQYGLSFAINVVLARILGPEPFGLVALAGIFISIGNLIIDSGLSSSLIQKKEITRQDIEYVFTLQLFLALVIGGIITGLAPIISRFYQQPAVIPVLQLLALTMLFEAAGQTSVALLRRKMAFHLLQKAQIGSYLLGFVGVGLPGAYLGYGVWSLVFAQLVQRVVFLFIVYAATRHPIGLVTRDSGGVSRFGLNILGANIANWLISNYDNTSIGWAYGPTDLGYYSRAWNLAMNPVQIVISSAQSVLFSSTSKLQESAERIREIFLGIFTFFGLIIFPLCFSETIVAKEIIQFVYGEKWLVSGPFMAVLVLAMPFFALMALEGPVLAGIGKPQYELKVQWFVLAFTLVVFVIAIRFDVLVIVWSVLIVYVVRFVALSSVTFRVLQVSRQKLFTLSFVILLFTFFTTAAVYITGTLVGSFPLLLKLLTQAAAGTLCWVLLFMVSWNRVQTMEVKKLLSAIVPKQFIARFKLQV